MRKFIFKSAVFIIPFSILYLIAFTYNSAIEHADVIRMGCFPNVYKDYKAIFPSNTPIKFEKLSETKNKKFKIMTIGDSFSDQKGEGYINALTHDFSVLYVDRYLSNNQVQTLINLLNGDFFDHYELEYVILENVQRQAIDNIESLNFSSKTMLSEIDSLIQDNQMQQSKASTKRESNLPKLFSKNTLEFPLHHMYRFYTDKNYLANELVYNLELDTNAFFSNQSNKLLFYFYDLISVEKNNAFKNVVKLDSTLNEIQTKLSEKGIQLIYLPCPDKYDLYYDHISDKTNFPKPLFFEHLRKLKKDYIYIDSKAILSKHLKTSKDIYYYDDTHWSPVATKFIAKEIRAKIYQHKNHKN